MAIRKDIQVSILSGDMRLSGSKKVAIYPTRPSVYSKGLQRYYYIDVLVPSYLSNNHLLASNIYVTIPYTAVFKEICVRICKTDMGNNVVSTVQNPNDGTEWFEVKCALFGGEERNIRVSELPLVHNDTYLLCFEDGMVKLYSGEHSDAHIIDANRQNANFMLACYPSNLYRFPLSGVGAVRWVNGRANNIRLANILQREFAEDGAYIKNAHYNAETNQLNLDVDVVNANS